MNTYKTRGAIRALFATGSLLALAAAAPGAAFAQDAANVGEVVVTASRVQAAGFTAPTPTTVIGVTELSRRAATNVQESLLELPSVRSTTTPQSSSNGATGANSTAGSSLVDLRGLTAARTLTLVNGRRTGATTDLRQFPTGLIQRIDVVTGGASAAYGSDAVAGVVNIVLDTKFTGLKGNLQYGVSKYGDDKSPSGSLAWGHDLFGGRGHILIGGDYSQSGGAHTSYTDIRKDQRPWFAANRFTNVANPCPYNAAVSTACPSGGNGLPQFVDADNIGNSTQMNPGGVIVSGPLKGITFDDGGIPRQFQYGLVIGNQQIGGEGTYPAVTWIRPWERHYSLLGRFDFKINDATNLWLEYANAYSYDRANFARPRDQGNLTIQRDNAFMPASIRAQMVALNLTTLTMGRFNNDGVPPFTNIHNRTFRYAAGLDGKLGGTWTWDGYFQYGVNRNFNLYDGNRNTARWNFALDSVLNPQGVAVCRAVLNNNPNAAGCVPFNIFGPNAASQAARDYVFGVQTNNNITDQYSAQFNIHGEPINTWAGPVAVATGLEYRRESSRTYSDPIAQVGGWDSGNAKAVAGNFNVKEGYAEVAVPLAKEAPFAYSLDLNAAYRYAKYTSVKKGVSTYKIGGTWRPIQEILLRTTYSKDVRAPSISQLFAPSNTSNTNIVQFQGPKAGTSTFVPFTSGGNPNLTEETGKTWTAGITLQPKFTRLRFSADYYSIKMTNQIGTVNAQQIIDLCAKNLANACSLLTLDSTGTIVAGVLTNVNNSGFNVRGIDFEASYSKPLSELPLHLPGTLSGRVLATRTLEFASITIAGREDKVGQNAGGVFAGEAPNYPYWILSESLSYNVGKFTGGVSFKHISDGVVESTSITGTATTRLNNNVHAQTITNLNASYLLVDKDGRKLQLYGVINNLFNKGPPFPIYPANGPWSTFYDALGTDMRVGVRFQY